MPTFHYRAKQGPDKVVEGNIEARNEKDALEQIDKLGMVPVLVEESSALPQGKPRQEEAGHLEKVRLSVPARQVTVFSRQLSSLLKAGVPILASLSIIAEQSENPQMKKILNRIRDVVKEGVTFSAALARFPQVFPSLYVAMVRTGEDSGVLADVLLRIAEYRAKEEEAVSKVRMALAYPILMSVVGLGTVIFMLAFVMPRLMDIFLSLGQQLPLPTRILLKLSRVCTTWWVWPAVAVAVLTVVSKLKTPRAKEFLSRAVLNAPVVGKVVLMSQLGRFSRTMELLIKSGIPILRSIEVAAPVVGNQVLKERVLASYKALEQGGSFGKSLRESKAIPLFMSNLIVVGEESGKLSAAFGEVANAYEHDTDEAIKIMTNLIEPLLILVMGLIVGFIVIAMLLPVFELNISAR